VQNGQPFHAAMPVGDHLGDDNKPAYASLNAIQNAARVGDYGFCLDAVAACRLFNRDAKPQTCNPPKLRNP
jgi:hypothetical protein